jgi:hypothetical protein
MYAAARKRAMNESPDLLLTLSFRPGFLPPIELLKD